MPTSEYFSSYLESDNPEEIAEFLIQNTSGVVSDEQIREIAKNLSFEWRNEHEHVFSLWCPIKQLYRYFIERF